jgi:hypothetical protein
MEKGDANSPRRLGARFEGVFTIPVCYDSSGKSITAVRSDTGRNYLLEECSGRRPTGGRRMRNQELPNKGSSNGVAPPDAEQGVKGFTSGMVRRANTTNNKQHLRRLEAHTS